MKWKRTPNLTCEMFYVEHSSDNEQSGFIVVETFDVLNYREAIEHARKYNETHKDSKKVYYWRRSKFNNDYGLLHSDGLCSYGADDVDCFFIDWIAKVRIKMRNDKDFTNRRTYVKKIARIRKMSSCKFLRIAVDSWIKISDFLVSYFWVKPINKFESWRWNRKNYRSWRKTGHSLDEHWNFDLFLLKSLKHNLKKLIEDGNGINTMFIKDVISEEHPEFDEKDIEGFMYRYMCSCDDESRRKIEDLAVKKQKETYERICHLVDLYTFYYNNEIDGHTPLKTELTPDMKNHYIEGTYDVIDHMKNAKEGDKAWNEIWDLVKKYGQMMYS